jgi:hypothetical protein
MAKQIVVALVFLGLVLSGTLAWAQDQDEEKVFNLIVGDDGTDTVEAAEDEDQPQREPQIEAGKWGVTLTLGYNGVSGTLLERDRLIYKTTDDAFLYGDITIEAESAFNPILRGSYNLTTWFALEVQAGITFAEYTADIANPMAVDPEETGTPIPVAELGEFDRENRSTLIVIGNVNGIFYPFNLDGDGKGRFHPYLTGGLGYAMYNIDSDYTDDSTSSVNVNAGIGVNLIADDLISLRAEMIYQVHTVEFDPAATFEERDGGTEVIPVYEFTEFGQYSEVEEFGSNTLSGLTWQVGFMLGF